MSFRWVQDRTTVTVSFNVPSNTRRGDCIVHISRSSLTAGLKGAAPVINGVLWEAVNEKKSKWNVQKGKVSIILEKASKSDWRDALRPDPLHIAQIASGTDTNTVKQHAAAPAPQPTSTAQILKHVRALWDYAANEPEELSFQPNQIIAVYAVDDSGWWAGQNLSTGATGQFPSNFVEECAPPSEMTPTAPSQSAPPPSFSTAPPTLSPRDVTPQADEVVDESKPKGIAMPGLGDGGDMSELRAKLKKRGGNSTAAEGSKSLRSFTAKVPESAPGLAPEGTQSQGRRGRGRGRGVPSSRGRTTTVLAGGSTSGPGVPPRKYPAPGSRGPLAGASSVGVAVRPEKPSQPFRPVTAPRNLSSSPQQQPAANPSKMWVIAKYDYSAQGAGELSFSKGEKIEVVEKDASGWWQGVLNGQAGWLSADFVEEIAATPVATAILDEMKPETQHLKSYSKPVRTGRRLPTRGVRPGKRITGGVTTEAPGRDFSEAERQETKAKRRSLSPESPAVGRRANPLTELRNPNERKMSEPPKPSWLRELADSSEEKASPKSSPLGGGALKRIDTPMPHPGTGHSVQRPGQPKAPGKPSMVAKAAHLKGPPPTPAQDGTTTTGQGGQPPRPTANKPASVLSLKKPIPPPPSTGKQPTHKAAVALSPRGVAGPDHRVVPSSPVKQPANWPAEFGKWNEFCACVRDAGREAMSGKIGGTVASSPTSLSRAPKNAFGVSVCSVDGCSFGVGQCETSVPVQGAGAFISGCVASSQESLNSVMSLVANQMCVNDEFQVSRDGKPLHLVSEAGLIATSSCILANFMCVSEAEVPFELTTKQQPASDRIAALLDSLGNAVGDEVQCCLPSYLSAKDTDYQCQGVAYMMASKGMLSNGCNVATCADFAMQIKSIALSAHSGAKFAATVANEGICCVDSSRLFVDSGVCSKLVSAIDKRFEAAGTRNACLVSSSGLHFIFVPKAFGICIWAPALNNDGIGGRAKVFLDRLRRKYSAL